MRLTENEINEKIESLSNSPMYSMSLGSRELFHSNFWKWLFTRTENKEKYIKIFFPNIENDIDYDKIKREEGHRDITIWCKNKAYVIENKIKTLPNEKQLNDYRSDLKERFADGVYTGLYDSLKKDCPEGWKFISYETIGSEIKQINQSNNEDDWTSKLIDKYADMLIDISKILRSYLEEFNGKLILKPIDKDNALSIINLNDILFKINADQACQYLKGKLSMQSMPIERSFNNSKSTLTFRIPNNKTEKSGGIQIEGNQYRRFLEIKGQNKIEAITKDKNLLLYNWFDRNYNKNSKVVFSRKTSMNPKNEEFDCYTKPNTFIYQYWDIDEPNITTQSILGYKVIDLYYLPNLIKGDLDLLKTIKWV